MSIATLKKKTGYLYSSQSVGYKNFSLNGTHRSQGWVGQTMLSRSLPRTLSLCNTGLDDLNDNSIIKSSVGNTRSMLEVRNNCLKQFNYKKPTIVKEKFGLNKKSQSDHIANILKNALACYNDNKKTKNENNINKNQCSALNSKYMKSQYSNINTDKALCSMTKNTDTTVLQEGVYIDNLKSKCIETLNYPVGYTRGPLPSK
jgi:hypothetical protein